MKHVVFIDKNMTCNTVINGQCVILFVIYQGLLSSTQVTGRSFNLICNRSPDTIICTPITLPQDPFGGILLN